VLQAGGLVAGAGVLGGASAALPAAAGTTGSAVTAAYTPPSVRQRIDLNGGWRFLRADASGAQSTTFNDSSWSAVSVPHTWNAQDGQDGGSNYYRGIGWYRRHYTPPSTLAGKKLWLQFAGVNQVADVWVNGVSLGQHKGGYARFRFDATGALKLGQDNVIAVRVNNANDPSVPPLSADFTFFGGIYRNVSLQVTDPLSMRMLDFAGPGIYLRQRSVSATSATVDVTARAWNNSSATRSVAVRAVVADAAGTVVADVTTAPRSVAAATGFDATQTVTIANPHRWQGKTDPYLYNVTVELHDTSSNVVTDAVTERLGLRSFSVDANAGFLLNGQHLALHGVNRHQDRLNLGWAIGDAEHTQDFDLMDEMGVNALRTAHYQQDQKVYNLADERGYVVWAEIPLVNSITNSSAFTASAIQQLHELIKQNYNHPSIVFWGIGNEQGSDDTATNALLDTLNGVVNSDDPDRLSTYAHNGSITSGLCNHTEVNGYNRYSGWYSGAYTDFGPWCDNLHSTQPARHIGISEYGAGASIIQHQENPPKPVPASAFHPEEYQALFHESYWSQIRTRPFLWGTFIWNMFDFASDGRNEGDTPGRNDKGMVTYDRLTRKDAFFWYKANWTPTRFVYITSRRWTARTVATTTIKVYGNVDSVVLKLNGVQLGAAKTSTNHIYSWANVTLAPGANTVQAIGTVGSATFTDTVTWNLA
jgi:beta-galactosidase